MKAQNSILPDDEIEDMVRDLIENCLPWDEVTRDAALKWFDKVMAKSMAVDELLQGGR